MKRHDEDEGDALSRKKARVLKHKSALKRVEKPLAPADACVGVVVLGNSTLLRHVTSFLPGIPHRLLELEVNNGVTMDARRKANKAVRDLDGLNMYLDRETPQVKSLIENHRLAYRSLTDMAIETN
ncbi:hypothetical protein Poli38472_010196 [Pythium oligandrum]|uniref:Uncharacterized protein n=1 Tax=Pythium oligandrum TaxID=41045 RepID=A0A8K1FGF2_PYTOL|nr:hypothetical protein Poli38472_010196 [Pythium oligandrum]|eukprot:TMW58637.1 hypothetical protein Poli38472_010196 [Pythium oligandrum]